jgi:hypothetical protein
MIIEQLIYSVANIAPRPETIAESEACIIGLAPTSIEKKRALGILLRGLARLTGQSAAEAVAIDLAPIVRRLTCTAEDREHARTIMLDVLAGAPSPYNSARLINAIAQLAQDPHEKSELRRSLLNLMHTEVSAAAIGDMAIAIFEFDPTARDNANARAVVLAAMGGPVNDLIICGLARALSLMTSPPGDCRQARRILLARMTAETADNRAVCELASSLRQLDPTTEDKHQARHLLLTRMTTKAADNRAVCELASSLRQLDPTTEDKHQARHLLLTRMTTKAADNRAVCELASSLRQLDPTTEDKHQARHLLLTRMTTEANPTVFDLAQILAQLDPIPAEKQQACDILATLAGSDTRYSGVDYLAKAILEFRPTVENVRVWRYWERYSSIGLLSAVRHNSSLISWLASLPSYAAASTPSGT